jgi:hypothetical protein
VGPKRRRHRHRIALENASTADLIVLTLPIHIPPALDIAIVRSLGSYPHAGVSAW